MLYHCCVMLSKSILVNWFAETLTPKFYVALTGTSSFISGIILIFEWWYFKKYGVSFIEHVSLTHISPWFGVDVDLAEGQSQHVSECKVWRNPLNLFRGAEYQRFYAATQKEPLTFHDMNLMSQDQQTFFVCELDKGKPECELMLKAWRERKPEQRIEFAKQALEEKADYVPALLLIAEEECTMLVDIERILRQAFKLAETQFRKSAQAQQSNSVSPEQEVTHKRDSNIYVYAKRRLAMCLRRLKKIKEAVKLFRELVKDFPVSPFNVHENLIEALLELQQYPDVQSVLTRYDDISLPKSACICYSVALLKARAVADKFSPDIASKRGLSTAEMAAVEAIHRAVEFNPHVPKYLLEMKPLVLPPEHILKRGDSEAVAYSFYHLRHWMRIEGALNLLHCTWEGTFRALPNPLESGQVFYPYPSVIENMDKEILPPFHDVSVYPKKELPFFILFTAGLCSVTALLAILTHKYPDKMADLIRNLNHFKAGLDKIQDKKMSSD
ncbi:hypothetical protein EB796_011420 [Bugula neritina]|uniref:Protein ST7 homolog n=1 Tax=Bugula neritina TaxID=10212 RepID=A0A7J7JV54_BUGNE|nr:hypothetical protein EB796_011420 [Bugula neritina]